MLVTFALALALGAANPALGLLETAKEQLSRHDDVAARKTIERALPYAADDRLLLGQLYQLLGLAWAEAAYDQRAIEAFTTALKLDRSLTLPPDTAPKVQDWWKRAGGTIAEPVESPQQPEPAPQPAEPALQPPPPTTVVTPAPVVPAPAEVVAVEPSRLWWSALPAGGAVLSLVFVGVTWKLSDDRYRELAQGTRPLLPAEADGLYASGRTLQSAAQWLGLAAALFALATVAVIVLAQRE